VFVSWVRPNVASTSVFPFWVRPNVASTSAFPRWVPTHPHEPPNARQPKGALRATVRCATHLGLAKLRALWRFRDESWGRAAEEQLSLGFNRSTRRSWAIRPGNPSQAPRSRRGPHRSRDRPGSSRHGDAFLSARAAHPASAPAPAASPLALSLRRSVVRDSAALRSRPSPGRLGRAGAGRPPRRAACAPSSSSIRAHPR